VRAVAVAIPKRLAEELERRGVDVGSLVVDLLVKALDLDPRVGVEARLELASKYLEEGRGLVDKDPVQASEKLYKAAEEAVKAFTAHLGLSDVLKKVGERGRWTVTELEKAVRAASEKLGRWFRGSWDAANYLHVWGFHEAKLEPSDVRDRLSDVERMVLEVRKAVGGS
jgi:hypothetical protein